MLKEAESVGPAIAALKERVVKKGLPVIYANDNYGKWRSDFKGIVQYVCVPFSVFEKVTRQAKNEHVEI